MFPLYLFLLLLFLGGVIFLLHIPLPADIADRKKLQVAEFILRVGNEYAGDLVETLFGARTRNSFTRFVMRVGFLIPFSVPEYLTVRDDIIAGVRVRVYTPKERKSKGAVVFIHGGGWATMKPEYYDSVLFGLVRKLGVVVFSIDYRLAPEHPHPAAVDDCEAVVRELHDHKSDFYSFDKSAIALVGDSAGGNLTAVVTQKLTKSADNYIKCQVLIYPVVHVFGFHSPSYIGYYQKFKGSALLNPRAMARWILFYLGQDGNKENVKKLMRNQHISKDLRSSPEFEKLLSIDKLPEEIQKEAAEPIGTFKPDTALCEVFSRLGTDPSISPIFGVSKDLPPALVLTAGYDVLRDEGILYAKRLQDMGVDCKWKHFPKAFHGLFNMPMSPHRMTMAKEVSQFLEERMC